MTIILLESHGEFSLDGRFPVGRGSLINRRIRNYYRFARGTATRSAATKYLRRKRSRRKRRVDFTLRSGGEMLRFTTRRSWPGNVSCVPMNAKKWPPCVSREQQFRGINFFFLIKRIRRNLYYTKNSRFNETLNHRCGKNCIQKMKRWRNF